MFRFLFYTLIFTIGLGCKDYAFPSLDIQKEVPFSWKEKEECMVVFNYEGQSVEMPAAIKYRGGISAQYKKNSFSLELEKKYKFFDFPKDDDYILNANYIDKTFMRHKLNYDLFQAMGPKNIAAKSNYLNVLVNGEYNGLYLFTEEINGKKVGLNKKDTMAMLFKDPLFLYVEERVPQDSNNIHQQKFPKIHKRDQTYYLDAFRKFLFESSDEEFDREIGNWVDLENIIDWHLLLLFTNNGDGIMKNFYLYKKDSTTPFRIAIWDYDHTFGRDGDNELNMMERPLRWKRSILLVRLLDSKSLGYKTKLDQRWKELRDSGLFSEDHIASKINEIDKLIHEEVEKNVAKWPVKGYWYYDDNNYEQEKEIINQFVTLRLSQLDQEFLYSSKD
ncbi:MAG: CotH kinase family protein [Saprospiraceae bacterium]|nr:CotH kinase family protein [Saprospiraceae bacterium]